MGQRNNGKRRREKENDGLVVKIFMNFDKFSLKIEELLVQSFSVCPWIKGVTLFGSTDWLQTLCLASVVDVFSRYDTGS